MELLFEHNSRKHTGQALLITEDTVTIASPFAVNGTVSIPVSSILEVVFYPIVQAEAGLGGWIKFVTADNRSLPVKNYQIGWEVVCKDGVHKGQDLAAGNCFWYGCDWGDDGKGIIDAPNREMEKAVALVKNMLPERPPEPARQPSPPTPASVLPSPEQSREAAPPAPASVQKEEKRSFLTRLLGGHKNNKK